MKKVVLKLCLRDQKEKQKAMTAVSGLPGIVSTTVDMKDGKLTVTGDFDPVVVVSKLKKRWHAEILTFGPAKEEEKKDGGAKKDDSNKKVCDHMPCNAYNPCYMTPCYRVVMDDNPNSCVIC